MSIYATDYLHVLLHISLIIVVVVTAAMDIGLNAQSPSGVHFMPSSPPPAPNGRQVWPDNIDYAFSKWIYDDGIKKHRKLLTPQTRMEYRLFLANRNYIIDSNLPLRERNRLAQVRFHALNYYELQDN